MRYNLKPKEFPLDTYRKNNKLPYRKLASIVGVDSSYLYGLEKGVYTASTEMAVKIFRALLKWESDTHETRSVFYNFIELLDELKNK